MCPRSISSFSPPSGYSDNIEKLSHAKQVPGRELQEPGLPAIVTRSVVYVSQRVHTFRRYLYVCDNLYTRR